jgi:hypothetical protein
MPAQKASRAPQNPIVNGQLRAAKRLGGMAGDVAGGWAGRTAQSTHTNGINSHRGGDLQVRHAARMFVLSHIIPVISTLHATNTLVLGLTPSITREDRRDNESGKGRHGARTDEHHSLTNDHFRNSRSPADACPVIEHVSSTTFGQSRPIL